MRFWLGMVVPGVIVALVVFNLISGRVYWLGGRSGVPAGRRVFVFQVFEDGWRVTGTILMKLGVAGALFAWFYLANHGRTERVAVPILVAGVGVAVMGLVVYAVGFF